MAIIFNEDPNHYIYTRYLAGKKALTEQDLREFIHQYKNTYTTDFLVCLNASQPFFPSKSQKSIIDRYEEWEASGELEKRKGDPVVMSVGLLRDAYVSGLEFHRIWLDEIRKCGMRAWASVRMNDIHDAEDPNAFLPSDFVKAHPEYLREAYRGPVTHPEYALDYSFPAVREHYFSLIAEIIETFDIDGLELDFMREPYCFAIGREQEGLPIMTDFVGKIYERIKSAEERLEHKIHLAVRVPGSPEKAMRLGFDVIEWVNQNYVDSVFVTPHWSSSDGDMPIDLWRKIFCEKNVRIAAGLEILLDAYNRRGRKYQNTDIRSAVGFACAYDALGANDIYLFNFMDRAEKRESDILFGEKYTELLTTIGDRGKMIYSPRRHVVTFCDTWMPAETSKKPLPLTAYASENGTGGFAALRIPTGIIPPGKRVTVVLGFERGGASGEDVAVYANCKKCRCLGVVCAEPPAYDDMDYFAYEVENDGKMPVVTMAEIGARRGAATVHWAEIDVE